VAQKLLDPGEVEWFVKQITDIIELCRDYPRAALAVATEGLSVQLSNRSSVLPEDDVCDGVSMVSSGTEHSNNGQTSPSNVGESNTAGVDVSCDCSGGASQAEVNFAVRFTCCDWFSELFRLCFSSSF
jgi:hypothetical protein